MDKLESVRSAPLTSPNQLSSHWCHSPKTADSATASNCPVAKIPDRERARYLLASDLIQQQQGEKALKAMDSLEQNYPAANIALKRAKAYDLTGDKAKLRQRGMIC